MRHVYMPNLAPSGERGRRLLTARLAKDPGGRMMSRGDAGRRVTDSLKLIIGLEGGNCERSEYV